MRFSFNEIGTILAFLGITHAIQEIFETATIPADLGVTNLALISKINHPCGVPLCWNLFLSSLCECVCLFLKKKKKNHPNVITQIRTISLCNTFYKLVS